MKIKKLLFLSIALLIGFTSCNDDDENSSSSDLASASLSFNANEPPITVPTAMSQSSDPMAAQTAGFIEMANGMSTYISLMQPPTGAAKSSTPVGRKSGDNGRTENNVVVYTWTEGDVSIAYQISETSTNYIFELFWKFSPTEDFKKYLHAEESKLSREGFFEFYNIFDEINIDQYVFRYQWREAADGTFYFDFLSVDGGFEMNIISNPDNSGSIQYYSEGSLFYDIEWNADGSGSWVYYNEDGTVADSGEWTV